MSLRDKFNKVWAACKELEPRYKAAFGIGVSAWALRTGFQIAAILGVVDEIGGMEEFSFSTLFHSPAFKHHAQNLAIIWPVTKVIQWGSYAYGATGFIPQKPDPV